MKKQIAVVLFDSYGKEYEFKNVYNELEIGDSVVVDTRNGLTVGEVIGFKLSSHQATKHIVQKIDVESHQKRVEVEQKKDELKEALAQRAEELKQLNYYKDLAAGDPKMKELLGEFESLQ